MKNKRVTVFLLWISGITLLIFVILLVGYIYEPFAQKSDSIAYPPPGKMIDIGGYKLHLNCLGTKSPTVIIDAGWGDWSSSWKYVQDKVAKQTRVCTYDRAGMGWSDVGPKPRTAKQFSKELHILLQKTNILSPFILVGHSSGGFTARVYTHEYPSDVSGVVLIDSMSPKQFKSDVMNAHNTNTTREFSPVPLLARFGIVRLFTSLSGMFENVSHDEKSNNAITSSPKFLQTFVDEGEGLPESAFQASQVKSFGEIPLLVLSRGKDDGNEKTWGKMQDELLQLSKHNQHLIAQSSGHNIQLEQPDSAVNAIIKMVKQIRLESLKH